MKTTAMQKLIEFMGMENDWASIYDKAAELLNKEKEQIEEANDDGYNECVRVAKGDSTYDINYGEKYYRKTYNQ